MSRRQLFEPREFAKTTSERSSPSISAPKAAASPCFAGTATPPRSRSSTASLTAPSKTTACAGHSPLIEAGIDDGLRRAAELAPEGIRSIAVDGWAVDYVRLDADNHPLAAPFCYRDERTIAAQHELHTKISPERLHEITGVQLARLNTLYQLYADNAANLPPGTRWLNLPEYMLTRWGAAPFAEYTNATHTGLIDLATRNWSPEIFAAAGLDLNRAAKLTQPGTRLGKLRGPLADLPALRDTELIAPACHDTASAIAGIPTHAEHWAYISSGTWSLIGTLLARPATRRRRSPTTSPTSAPSATASASTRPSTACGSSSSAWTPGPPPAPPSPSKSSSASPRSNPRPPLCSTSPIPSSASSATCLRASTLNSGRMATLPWRSHQPAPREWPLSSFTAWPPPTHVALDELRHHTGHQPTEIVVVGGGCRNDLLCRLTAERTGLPVRRGAPESSTIGNLAVQLAALEGASPADPDAFAAEVSSWAATLLRSAEPASTAPAPTPVCNAANS